MQAVTVSSKFQVSIPSNARHRLGIKPGQKLAVTLTDDGLYLTPVPTLDELMGAFPGLSMEGLRDKADRL